MQTVLIIDDDDDICDLVVAALKPAGYRTLASSSGVKGIHLYSLERPDLVLTDIIMPDADGIEVIREIKQIDPTARIIAISGSYLIEKDYCLRMALQFGAMAVLPKPFAMPELHDLVKQCLRSAAPPFPPRAGSVSL